MALLAEYGLIPDVFDTSCYTNDELCRVCLQQLSDVVLTEGLVRNLREGDWLRVFEDSSRPWHKRGQEIVKKLVIQNRLRARSCRLCIAPTTDTEWCREAIASHNAEPLHGIVTTETTHRHFAGESLVGEITNLSRAPWWASRSPSIRLNRTIDAYRQHLRLMLACANSVMFIDPHLDPRRLQYRTVIDLLCGASARAPVPRLEVHRVCYFETRDKRDQCDLDGWKHMFAGWTDQLRSNRLTAEVFIWDDFHDRHVISDLVGISLANGLDTTTDPRVVTTWTRMGRQERDDIQREFDPASGRHSLRHRFAIPD